MKLILINGPTGIGKSTIAEIIHKKFPLSFLLDIDAQRRYLYGYREHRAESLALILELALAITDRHLASGHDVIIDKVFADPTVSSSFFDVGHKHGADTYEFILNADKDTLLTRATQRGFREGSLLTPEKVEEFWKRTQEYITNRPDAVVIDAGQKNVDEIEKIISKHIRV